MNIIAADIGGTKSHLVRVDSRNPARILHESRYQSNDFDDFDGVLNIFLREAGITGSSVDVLSLALPGVVSNDLATLTNLPWTVDRKALSTRFGIGKIHFMNDFQAAALGVACLEEQDWTVLNPGAPRAEGARVVIGAGTGLGLSWVMDTPGGPVAHATEGGHADFAPANLEQVALWKALADRYGHVSWERVVSGEGLVNIYQFLAAQSRPGVDAAWINQQAAAGDPVASDAIKIFVSAYGAYTGIVALMFNPEAGIFIAGGVAPRMLEWMTGDIFIDAYRNKGRMRGVVEQVSVNLVTNDRVGVIGAVATASRSLSEKD